MAAREGRSSGLVITGAPGMGRTALLDDAVAAAPADVTVLRAVGAEAERDLPHAALSALCRPVRPLLAQLCPASRTVLETALDLGPDDTAAPHAVGAALLDLLGLAAERAPVLVVVDDHQWVDASSRQALAFAVRRLGADRVCVLVAHRTDPVQDAAPDLPALPVLVLGPLDDLEVRRLLRALAPAVAAPVADAVVATASGSPHVLNAVVRALTAGQLAGQEPLPDPLPASGVPDTDRVLDAVPPDLALVLAVAAAEPSAGAGVLRRALRLLGLDPALLDEAERRRLVWLADGRVAFSSPLLRSVAYHRRAPAEHRALHAALAEVLETEDVERRAWHLAQGTVDRDDAVAQLLVEAGQRAAARGAPAQAAASYQRAGRLSEDPHRRAAALLAAAQQAVAAGHVEQARTLAAEVERSTDDVHTRAEARIVLARMTSLVGDPTTAYHSVHELVDDVEDPDLAARLCIEAVALAFKAATPQAVPWGLRAVQLAEQSADARLQVRARLALAVARAVHGEQSPPGGLLALVQRALDDGTPVTDIAVPLTEASIGLHTVGRSDEGLALIDLVARAARTARAVGVLPQILLARADLETSLNRYYDAWSTTAEAAELAERLGQHAVRRDLAFRLAGLQALRGHPDEARALYAEVLEHGSHDYLWLRSRRGLGVLELGAGRPEAAVHSLEQLDVLARTLGRPDLSFGIYEHDLTLGYLEVGRRADAEELAERFAGLVASSNHATGEASLAYVRALLAKDEDADPLFARAVELARPTPFLHVRALSAWAQVLARSGRPDEAAARVRAAREIAEAMGAPGVAAWVDRAASVPPARTVEAAPVAAEAQPAGQAVEGSHRRRRKDDAVTAPAAEDAVEDAAEPATMLCVLGRWELVVDGQVVPGPDGVPGKALRLLALRRQVHVEELTELLWPETDAQSGRMRLRNVVSRIRASVGPVVERRAELVSLCGGVEVDADRFAELARAAHAAAERGDDAAATALAERAVAMHLGPLLPDSPYADWALVPRERARRLHVGLLDLLATTAVGRGDVDAALSLLERAIEAEPYEEERYLRAAQLCLDAGRRGAAAAMLDRAQGVAAKLGVPADPRSVELAARLRRGSAAAAGG